MTRGIVHIGRDCFRTQIEVGGHLLDWLFPHYGPKHGHRQENDMTNLKNIYGALCLVPGMLIAQHAAAAAPEPIVKALLTKEMANIPGKEVLMLSVEYPPGGADPVHRHDAHGFIYVLEGTIVMGVKGV